MKGNWKFYGLIIICISFPILSVEDIIPWIVSLFFIHKSIKTYREEGKLKKVCLNTLYAGGIILVFNIVANVVEKYMVSLYL